MRPQRDDTVGTESIACQPVGTESIACQPVPGGIPETMPKELVKRIEIVLGKKDGRMTSKVEAALQQAGVKSNVVALPNTTRSAKEAAAAIGCEVAEIAKSIVFRGAATDSALLVVTSGTSQVDEGKLGALAGEAVERATPEFVRERTGFAIGGVAPIGHSGTVRIFVDVSLMKFDKVWAAAGTPFAVFCCNPTELLTLTGVQASDVAK